MLTASSDTTFFVTPSIGALAVAIIAITILGTAVLAAKGRWGWLLIGLLTGGALLPILAILVRPAPHSIWARVTTRTLTR